VVAGVVAGAAIGMVLSLLGQAIPSSARYLVGGIVVCAALFDIGGLRCRRCFILSGLPPEWMRLRVGLFFPLYGAVLGVGLLTPAIPALYAMAGLVMVAADPWLGALVFAFYALSRNMSSVVVGLRAAATDPQGLLYRLPSLTGWLRVPAGVLALAAVISLVADLPRLP
jgi:hypothetical protein